MKNYSFCGVQLVAILAGTMGVTIHSKFSCFQQFQVGPWKHSNFAYTCTHSAKSQLVWAFSSKFSILCFVQNLTFNPVCCPHLRLFPITNDDRYQQCYTENIHSYLFLALITSFFPNKNFGFARQFNSGQFRAG